MTLQAQQCCLNKLGTLITGYLQGLNPSAVEISLQAKGHYFEFI